MCEAEIIQRIQELCADRSWSYYRLVKESGISYSTLNTILNKGTAPSIPTLVRICEGFGITLEEFFSDTAATEILTPEEREHLQQWRQLSAHSKELAGAYIRALHDAETK